MKKLILASTAALVLFAIIVTLLLHATSGLTKGYVVAKSYTPTHVSVGYDATTKTVVTTTVPAKYEIEITNDSQCLSNIHPDSCQFNTIQGTEDEYNSVVRGQFVDTSNW